MKNVTFYCSCLLVLFLLGCEKDAMMDPAPEADNAFNLQMNLINDQGEIIIHTLTEKQNRKVSSTKQSKANPNDLTIADIVYPTGSAYDLAAVRTAGGINGEWQVNSVGLGQVVLKTIELYVDGNEATVGAIVDEVIRPGLLQVNEIIFIKMKDNGKGTVSLSDQSSTLIVYYPDWFLEYPTVDDFLLDFPGEVVSTNPNFGPLRDIAGQVLIK